MGAEHLRQTVGMGDVGAHGLHGLNDGGRRRRAGSHDLQPPGHLVSSGARIVRHGNQHCGRGAQMRDALGFNETENLRSRHLAKADVGAAHGSHAPGEAPAVAVKHRKGPQIDRIMDEIALQHFPYGVEVGAAMMVHDALGKPGGAAGIVDGGYLVFVIDRDGHRLRRSGGQKIEVTRPIQRLLGADVANIHQGLHLGQVARFGAHQVGELVVGENHFGVGVIEDVVDFLG